MKHIYFLALTALLFVGTALAGTVPDEPHVVVTGSYEVTAVPDILHISLDISEVGREVAEARASVEERSKKLIEALKSLKIDKKDINSAALKITPHYNWSNRVQIYVGTEVSRTIEVILRDIGNYDLLIRSIIDAKVARINNSKLKSTKEEDLRAEALRGAVADARGKAKLLCCDNARQGVSDTRPRIFDVGVYIPSVGAFDNNKSHPNLSTSFPN